LTYGAVLHVVAGGAPGPAVTYGIRQLVDTAVG
jgi:hypothetical protein